MAQWGNKKQAVTVSPTTTVETTEGAPIGTYVYVKGGGGDNANFGNTAGSRANTDLNMYKANAVFPTMPGMKVSVVPVAVADIDSPNSSVVTQTIKVNVGFNNRGDNYSGTLYANVVFANGYVAQNFLVANVIGGSIYSFDQVSPSPRGTIYGPISSIQVPVSPDLAVKAANTLGFDTATDQFLYAGANTLLQSQDPVTYIVPPGNTAIAPLVNNTTYYLKAPTASGFQIRDNPTDPGFIAITDTRTNTSVFETHYLRFADVQVSLSDVVITNAVSGGVGAAQPSPVAHTGWVIKREGTGGRTGRVHYETLVAMHSLANT